VRRKFEMNLESPKLDFRQGRHCAGRTPLIFKSGLGPTQICHQRRFIGVLLLERAHSIIIEQLSFRVEALFVLPPVVDLDFVSVCNL
jgi:hypothetical protein